MALYPKIARGTYVDVLIEDPNTPGTFIPLCGMTTRTFNDQVQTRDRYIRDCSDPESVPVRALISTGRKWDLSASGLYNRTQAALISAAVGQTRNYRFSLGEPDDDAVYSSYFEGPAKLTQRQIGGNDDDDITSELTFASDGAWVEHVV